MTLPHGFHRGVRYSLRRRHQTSHLLVYFRVHGRRYDLSAGSARLDEALREVHRRIDALLDTGHSLERVRLEEFVARRLRELELTHKPRTVRSYRPRLLGLVAYCHEREVEYVDQLSPAVLNGYRDHLLHTRGLDPYTVAHTVGAVLSPLLKAAWRQGLLPEDLTPRIEAVPYKVARRGRVLTRREVAGLLRALRRQVDGRGRAVGRDRSCIIRFLLWTGCRRDQGRFLRWEDVDLAGEWATLIAQKQDRGPRTIPLPRRLVRMLRALEGQRGGARRTSDSPYVFGELGHDAALHWLQAAAQAAGVNGARPVRLHDLRHTFASWGVTGPLGVYGVAEVLGHRNLNTTRIYLQPDWQSLRGKLNALR